MAKRQSCIAVSFALMASMTIGMADVAGAAQNPCSSIVNESGSEVTCDPIDLEISSGELSLPIPAIGTSVGVAEISSNPSDSGDSMYVANLDGVVTVSDLTSAGVISSGVSACSDSFYALAGYKESDNHAWYFNNAGSGNWIGSGSAVSADLSAANIITNATNNCSIVANPTNRNNYVGLTTLHPQIPIVLGANCASIPTDTVNVHGWVSGLAYTTLARTCWWGIARPGTDELSTADVGFNSARNWFSTLPANCSNAFDMVGVAVHEWGHVYGLDHASSATHPNLTMSSVSAPCTVAQRSLGKGDILGLLALYP